MTPTEPDIRPGQSTELLKELHILTRDGRLNQDSKRKLKQVYHLYQFIEKLLRQILAGKIKLPIVRMTESRKTARGVHLCDLADFIDKAREAALLIPPPEPVIIAPVMAVDADGTHPRELVSAKDFSVVRPPWSVLRTRIV